MSYENYPQAYHTYKFRWCNPNPSPFIMLESFLREERNKQNEEIVEEEVGVAISLKFKIATSL